MPHSILLAKEIKYGIFPCDQEFGYNSKDIIGKKSTAVRDLVNVSKALGPSPSYPLEYALIKLIVKTSYARIKWTTDRPKMIKSLRNEKALFSAIFIPLLNSNRRHEQF
jgi:hypothetical protein